MYCRCSNGIPVKNISRILLNVWSGRVSQVLRFATLLLLSISAPHGVGIASETSKTFDFNENSFSDWKVNGNLSKGQVGPRPPEFPDMELDNQAWRFSGEGFLLQADTGEDSFYDFANGDEITI